MEVTLYRKDLRVESRGKGNIKLNVFDFNLRSCIIYRADEIIFKDGGFRNIFKTRHEWVK